MAAYYDGCKLTKSILHFLKRIALSRVGHLLLIVHLCLVVYAFAQKPSYSDIPCTGSAFDSSLLAGRYYHFHYESTLMKTLTFLDIPSIALGSSAASLLSPFKFCVYTASWIEGLLILTFASLQWLLIGFFLQEIYRA